MKVLKFGDGGSMSGNTKACCGYERGGVSNLSVKGVNLGSHIWHVCMQWP